MRRSVEIALVPPTFLLQISYSQLKGKPGENIIIKSQNFQEKSEQVKFKWDMIYLNMQRQQKHIQKSYSHFNSKPDQLTSFFYHSQRITFKTYLQRGFILKSLADDQFWNVILCYMRKNFNKIFDLTEFKF